MFFNGEPLRVDIGMFEGWKGCILRETHRFKQRTNPHVRKIHSMIIYPSDMNNDGDITRGYSRLFSSSFSLQFDSCFEEANRLGLPLLCGYQRRFDPSFQVSHTYRAIH